ncbi:hypothetical protein [Dyadobacter sp. NIV53]|uniref:hypothetical protein n=1 Tax=Dyadobacter sp. NIV53 TaxID=2861765 RepID=UPI001C88DAFE|nr:hypothetical protein [Dyadobacter sp. NIV53]
MKWVWCFICFLLIACVSNAQDRYLKITTDCMIPASPFTNIYSIDNRSDNQLLGFLEGKKSGIESVSFNGNLTDTLAHIFVGQPLIGVETELVLILNELFLSGSENSGKFKLSMRLFSSRGTKAYTEILTVDSIYVIRGKNSNEKLLSSISDQLCEIRNRVIMDQNKTSENAFYYSLKELYDLDSLEKLKIPMYLTDKPARGIYKDYEHFKRNTPDIDTEIIIDTNDRKGIQVDRVFKNKNRKVKLDPTGIYAVSDGKKLIKVTSSGEFLEIRKQNFDFYYDRPGSFSSQEYPFAPNYFPGGGRIGTTRTGDLVIRLNKSDADNTPFYRFKINHRKGNSVPVSIVDKRR